MCCANSAHKALKLLLVNDVASNRIVNVPPPPYKVSAGDVSLLVCIFRVIVYFQNPDVWVLQIIGNPFGFAENFRICISTSRHSDAYLYEVLIIYLRSKGI